jgi:UDPglucose--hexose-1-phosphate uridylyltransferase
MKKLSDISEFRQDPVSGEWVLISTKRAKRPKAAGVSTTAKHTHATCAFENPQKSGNGAPLLWFVRPSKRKSGAQLQLADWFVQVIRNKFPALEHEGSTCPVEMRDGMGQALGGIGFHEVIITRPHDKSLGDMKIEEVELVLRAYQERIHDLIAEECLRYMLVFHNHGASAGASIQHPHSQLVALPVIPADVYRSIKGSKRYHAKYGKCVHCELIHWEKKKQVRVIAENRKFIAYAPYASHFNYEVRIYPKVHSARFETIATEDRPLMAEILITALRSLKRALGNPDYNFFIHTAPIHESSAEHYHWHLEIFPKTATLAGLELGTGMEVISVSPEAAAEHLRSKI